MQRPSPDAEQDLAACGELLRAGSKSFAAASWILPRRVRAPATALYAFCRVADDVVDEGGGASAVGSLRDRLARAYAGTPIDSPVDRAFARMAIEHELPIELMDALLEGFAWDAEGRRYTTIGELTAYAARVAGTVGAMMTVLMGVRSPDALARACDLGVAMQLGNIARDVGDDARSGRIYLPLAWLEEAKVDVDVLIANPRPSPGLARVVERLLQHADALYARSDVGIAALPRDCRASIRAASSIYAAIGHEIARRGYDSISSRAVVPTWRKLWLVVRALLGGGPTCGPARDLPALPETQFLVDVVAARPSPRAPALP